MNHSIHKWDPNTTTSTSIPRRYIALPTDVNIRALASIVYGMVGVLAIVGNILLLHSNRKLKFQKTRQAQRAFSRTATMNVLLQCLAWSGLLTGMICFPLSIVSFSVDILKNLWVCRTARYFHAFFSIFKLIMFFIIGIERYVGVFHPFMVPSKRTVHKLLAIALLLSSLVPLFIASMFSAIAYNLSHDRYTIICAVDRSSEFNRVGLIILSLVLYYIPVTVLTVMNVRIFKALRRRRLSAKESVNTGSQVQKRSLKSTNMFVMLIFSFIIPYSACVLYSSLRPFYKPYLDYSTDKMLRHLCGLMTISNAAIGPIVIIYSMPDLKNMVKGFLQTRVRPSKRYHSAVIAFDANSSLRDQKRFPT